MWLPAPIGRWILLLARLTPASHLSNEDLTCPIQFFHTPSELLIVSFAFSAYFYASYPEAVV